MKSHRFYYIGFLCFFVMVASGCRGEKLPDGCPPLQPCRITITLDGTALPEAQVTLYPEDGTPWTASGTTGIDGTSDIRVMGQYTGAPVGTFRVTVSKPDYVLDEKLFARLQAGNPKTVDPNDPDVVNRRANANKIKASVPVDQVAEPFRKKDTTSLVAKVVKGKNVFAFDVSAPKK